MSVLSMSRTKQHVLGAEFLDVAIDGRGDVGEILGRTQLGRASDRRPTAQHERGQSTPGDRGTRDACRRSLSHPMQNQWWARLPRLWYIGLA